MNKTAQLQEHNALLDNPQALRQQMANDGFLFFRGLLQGQLAFWLVGLLATLWNIVLFFPVMWQSVTDFPPVTLVLVIILLMMNLLYVYVRKRNGLASSWVCQIVANLIILYIPFLQ